MNENLPTTEYKDLLLSKLPPEICEIVIGNLRCRTKTCGNKPVDENNVCQRCLVYQSCLKDIHLWNPNTPGYPWFVSTVRFRLLRPQKLHVRLQCLFYDTFFIRRNLSGQWLTNAPFPIRQTRCHMGNFVFDHMGHLVRMQKIAFFLPLGLLGLIYLMPKYTQSFKRFHRCYGIASLISVLYSHYRLGGRFFNATF